MTPTAPTVSTADSDEFSRRLHIFVKRASPDDLRRAVYIASRYLERGEFNSKTNRVQLNNCTETFVTVTSEMARRLEQYNQAEQAQSPRERKE